MKKIVLIGDSIRMGYQQVVREQLADAAEVVTSEQNGGTSENVLAHLDEWAIACKPDIVHVNCGLHDLAQEPESGGNRVPQDSYRTNVRSVMEQLNERTDATVIWASTTPVNEKWHHENKPFDRFEADVAAYNAIAAEICSSLGVAIDDLYAAVVGAGRDDLLLPDGVHFKPEGSALLGKTVAECLRSVIA